MGLLQIDSTDITNQNQTYGAGSEPWNKVMDSYSIDTQATDTSSYVCDWEKWHGLYRNVPMLKAAIDKLAIWTVGKGYKADKNTKAVLDRIRGHGKDSFNGILHNSIRTYKLCGDSYAEITTDKAGRLTNLKPLDPGSIKIWANPRGIISKYEQVAFKDAWKTQRVVLNTWKPEEIFHLSNSRIADEIHGIPTSEKLQKVIKKWELAMDDLAVVFHRYVKPLLLWKLDTDDTTEIALFKSKADKVTRDMENMFIPKDAAELERMSIPQYSTLDPLPWIEVLQTYFITAEGIPDVILGHSKQASEATAKIIYLAFQQTIEWEQLYIQEQVKNQLGYKIDLEFPASIDPSLLTDSRKNQGGKGVTDLDPSRENKDMKERK